MSNIYIILYALYLFQLLRKCKTSCLQFNIHVNSIDVSVIIIKLKIISDCVSRPHIETDVTICLTIKDKQRTEENVNTRE